MPEEKARAYFELLGLEPGTYDRGTGPTHYRLLGFWGIVDNSSAISSAADRLMSFVKVRQEAPLAQDILNELARARVTLLNPQQKAAYDQELRERQARSRLPPNPVPPKPRRPKPRPRTQVALPVATMAQPTDAHTHGYGNGAYAKPPGKTSARSTTPAIVAEDPRRRAIRWSSASRHNNRYLVYAVSGALWVLFVLVVVTAFIAGLRLSP